MASESDAEYLKPDVLPSGFEMIPLPGHFFNMVGFRTSDDVVYLADSLSSRETLEKYTVSFIYDVQAYLDTLERVRNMSAKLFVPSHAAATEDIFPLAEYNISKVNEIADVIYDICSEPVASDDVIKKVFKHYGMVINMQQYVLVGSTVRSYLSWLKDTGRLETIAEDGMILWGKI